MCDGRTSSLRGREWQRHGAQLVLLLTAALWGATFVTVQDAVKSINPPSFLVWRFALSAAAVFGIIVARRNQRFTSRELRGGAGMGVFLGLGYLWQTLGLTGTSVSNAAFITALFTVFTPVFGVVFLGQRAPRVIWLAVVTSMVGMLLLTGSSGKLNPADGVVLLGACCFAGHILATGEVTRGNVDALRLTFVQMLVVAILALALSLATTGFTIPQQGDVWRAIAVVGLLAGAGGYFLQTWAQARLPASEVSLILVSESMFAAAASALFQGAVPGLLNLLGAGFVFGAVILVVRAPISRTRNPGDHSGQRGSALG